MVSIPMTFTADSVPSKEDSMPYYFNDFSVDLEALEGATYEILYRVS